jgi:hypothetical protein
MLRVNLRLAMFFVFCGVCGVLLAGCADQPEMGTGTVVGNEKKVVMLEETHLLELREDEQKIYEQYQSKPVEDLKQIDPIVAAKLYLHAVLNHDEEMEELLSVNRKPGDHQKLMQKVNSMKRVLTGVTKVKFVQVDNHTGYVEYPLMGEDASRFQMVKNEQGIWKVDTSSLIESS